MLVSIFGCRKTPTLPSHLTRSTNHCIAPHIFYRPLGSIYHEVPVLNQELVTNSDICCDAFIKKAPFFHADVRNDRISVLLLHLVAPHYLAGVICYIKVGFVWSFLLEIV